MIIPEKCFMLSCERKTLSFFDVDCRFLLFQNHVFAAVMILEIMGVSHLRVYESLVRYITGSRHNPYYTNGTTLVSKQREREREKNNIAWSRRRVA